MSLEEQIAGMTNHLEFTRLCNAIFSALYPTSFQIVDGTRADQGNDGYLIEQMMMLAYHCPTKPEKETDAKYQQKIDEDLKKVHKLQNEGNYIIKRWAFVTPRPLSNTVIEHLRRNANALGIEAISLSSTFLADSISRNKYIIHQFPFLHLPSIDSKLDEVISFLNKYTKSQQSTGETASSIKSPGTASEDFKRVVEIRSAEQNDGSKAQLRSFFYKSTDPYAQINAILGLLQWFHPLEDRFQDMVEWCDRGIHIVRQLGDKGHEAYLHAYKGYFLSTMYIWEDMQMYFSLQADYAIGIPFVTEPERQTVVSRLRNLEESFTREFNAALSILRELGSLELWGETLLSIGNAAGQRSFHFASTGLADQAREEKKLAIETLIAAKNAFAKSNNELSVGYAIHSLANQLRVLGEPNEALSLVEKASEIANKYKDFRLEQSSRILKRTIESGEIPNYMHGERGERKK